MIMDYKKYSLEKLEEWVHDALSCEDTTPQEIYNTIKDVVVESRQYHKHHASRAYELMCLLNGNGKGHIKEFDDCVDKILSCDKDDPSPECKGAWNDFWEVDENKSREYNLREAEYYNKRAQLDITYNDMIAKGYTMTDDGFWIPPEKKDRVKKWVLPTEVDGLTGDIIVNLPDDLLEAANLKEGDNVEWIDNGEGYYIMKKVTQPLKINE